MVFGRFATLSFCMVLAGGVCTVASAAETADKRVAMSNNYAGNSWRQAMLASFDKAGKAAVDVAQLIMSGEKLPKKFTLPITVVDEAGLDDALKLTPKGGVTTIDYSLQDVKDLIAKQKS